MAYKQGPVYPEALAKLGIESTVPGGEEREAVHRIIFDELVYGWLTDESRKRFNEIIAGLAARGCDAVVLGCTEIPLLVDPSTSLLPVLDSTLILARAALRRSAERQ